MLMLLKYGVKFQRKNSELTEESLMLDNIPQKNKKSLLELDHITPMLLFLIIRQLEVSEHIRNATIRDLSQGLMRTKLRVRMRRTHNSRKF